MTPIPPRCGPASSPWRPTWPGTCRANGSSSRRRSTRYPTTNHWLPEVEGAAHYLPAYAGNLDIMTSAALRTAEQLAAAATRPKPAEAS